MKYDYLIVGAGLFGAIFAYEAKKRGKKSLVIDRRSHTGGNTYCENMEGINVHKYGAHIFHTDKKEIWDYLGQFCTFNNYINSPVANYKGEIYNLPFNMNTFNKLWGVVIPEQAKKEIEKQIRESGITEPENLEEQAISLVGKDIYEKLVKGYTEKQWGRKATELPTFIIKRLPVRYTYDNNYFNDRYQGIPERGYNVIFDKLLEGIDVKLDTDFFENREELMKKAEKIVFTGMIDQYFEYRSLKFENEMHETDNYQGNAVVNYCEREIPYTRIIEHKHFEFGKQPKTVITKEYPKEWKVGDERYYPVYDEKNNGIFRKYKELAENEKNVIFGGRLADYKYYDMCNIIEKVLETVKVELG